LFNRWGTRDHGKINLFWAIINLFTELTLIIVGMGIFSIPAGNRSGVRIEDSVRYGDIELSYGVTYSPKRKSLAILLHDPDTIEVKAPAGFSLSSIRKIVLEKLPWIRKKQAGLAESGSRAVIRTYSSGELFRYLGSDITLSIVHCVDGLQGPGPFNGSADGGPDRRIRRATDPPAILSGTILTLVVPGSVPGPEIRGFVKTQVLAWYRDRATRIIGERVRYFSTVLNVPAPEYRVRNIRKRWGSCSGNNHLSFNLRLVMAPENQIDYVVLHEMCHIIHKDHQARFWSDISRYMPDYVRRKDELKREGWQYVL
jgi:predicted metal-dependent hydrolase